MNDIIIICSGEDYSEKKIKSHCRTADFKIAVDGGLKVFDKLKIKPDLIIGDMDSIEKKILLKYPEIEKTVYPAEKNLTDSELAIKKAIGLNPASIFIFAATGSYFDHSLANSINLIKNYKKNINIKIITGNSEIFVLKESSQINNCASRRISLFPFSEIFGLELSGFKYTFDKQDILPFEYSISNVIMEKTASINFIKGIFICVLFDETYG